jgi:hypothetical protein
MDGSRRGPVLLDLHEGRLDLHEGRLDLHEGRLDRRKGWASWIVPRVEGAAVRTEAER